MNAQSRRRAISKISSENEISIEDSFPVVAVGASAGGLDALEKLFGALPADTGAVFVVIQHLSPDHKSMMASLLSRHTSMPVMMVEEDTQIHPNNVYLISPGSIMHLDRHILRLTPKNPRTLTLPVDVFFQSMAAHIGEYSIGVVLSGTGSDGTRGAGAINEAGGFLIAQDPENARFDGMPRSVISTGLVDAILPVEAIAERIVAHIRNPAQPGMRTARQIPTESIVIGPDAALAGIFHLLLDLGGINFDDYKPGTVMRRIERRMVVQQVSSIEAYLTLLSQDRAEVLTLRRELLIPVTSFFRDTDSFDALRKQVVEPIISSKDAGQTVRIWCAGIATGEEAYSIGMLFMEACEALRRWPTIKIFATDVEQLNIETASAGVYPESIAAEIPGHQLERFFLRRGNHFVVKTDLRQCIVFARHNLLRDPPFTKMDLVVCRNTLIYFRPAAQERALRRMQYALAPKGYLFLGSSESLGEVSSDFQTLAAKHKIWQVTSATSLPLDISRSSSNVLDIIPRTHRSSSRSNSVRYAPGAVDQGFATLLKAFTPPPAVLVNSGHELVHSYGDVDRFLRIHQGQASLDVMRVLPDELIPVAAAVLFKSSRENSQAISGVIRVSLRQSSTKNDESSTPKVHVRLSAWPVGEAEGQKLTLLAFETVTLSDPVESSNLVDVSTETTDRINQLEHELLATRESLQATIEELETSNEELQATNEEMMASNEELQSSNEELQSVNEELNTVNAEFQEKIDILNRVNADLDSLTRVSSTGTVFMDQLLNLTRFNPDAAVIFRLRESDIGRPLADLAHNLIYPELLQDIQKTLATNTVFEKAVSTLPLGEEGIVKRLLLKMLPYKIPSSSSKGLVLSFTDVTALHELSHLQSIIDALGENIAVLDYLGNITMINKAWQEFAVENGDETLSRTGIGVNYINVCEKSSEEFVGSDAKIAVNGIKSVLNGTTDRFTMEYPCHSANEQRWFVMHARRLPKTDPGGTTTVGAVVSHVNITEWRQHLLSQ